jgi:hypothetical protein
MSQLAERRRAHRRLTEAELIFFHRGIPLAARLLDLSESGARLSTAEFLRLRTPLVVVLSARETKSDAHGARPLRARGERHGH